jgi:hypothetical protein
MEEATTVAGTSATTGAGTSLTGFSVAVTIIVTRIPERRRSAMIKRSKKMQEEEEMENEG